MAEHSNAAGAGPLLEMKRITKRFPGVVALDGVDFELMQGETLGLIGENGAGKSTLMRILGGDHPMDEGEVSIDGERVRLHGVRSSIRLGISLIYQELNLAPNLDIASNIFLGREPASGPARIVDSKKLYADAAKYADYLGLSAPLTTLVENLSPGEQQLVEIAKALSLESRIIVFDEPTSSLSASESERLFEVIARLKKSGVSVIYISHRLFEIEKLCDRVMVMRDGKRVGVLEGGSINREEMVGLMVGRDIGRFFPEHRGADKKRTMLSVKNLKFERGKSPASFDVAAGEIMGIAGLVGAGRTELVRALFGVDGKISGEIAIDGKKVDIKSPGDAVRAGLGLVPEDRKGLGVILEMAIRDNITLPGIGSYNPPFTNKKRENEVAAEMAETLEIRTPNLDQDVQNLSGGNQQKVALAKWLALNPKALILDEPTRGIDVGSKSEIYALIRRLADEGMAVIMVSSELEEIIGLADSVLVMHEGRVTGRLGSGDITEEDIMQLATGGRKN